MVSADYINPSGVKGVEGFQKSLLELAKAFPDAQWKAEEILADGNKVVVKQKFTGTHTNQFQNFRPTSKKVSVDGFTTFELQNGKIIDSLVLTDRLGFLQQLGVLPIDLSTLKNKN
jgi:predicted ester cyclase